MRVVRNLDPLADVDGALLPSRDTLERARTLTSRFASAGLVPLTLTLAPALSRGKARVWLAIESMQVTGSFKVRGALLAVESLCAASPGKKPAIVAASAGNHGIGVAFAAKTLGASATVVVPSGTPAIKVEKIAAYGGTVVTARGASYDAAEAEAIALAKSRGSVFLSPYDDPNVVAGNGASLGYEIIRALGKLPDRIVCPIGGGGLATGLGCALEATQRRVRPITVVQSEASPAFALSLERGAAVTTLPPAETLAEGLEGGISAPAFARAKTVVDQAWVATEASVRTAMLFAVRELGLVLEGSAAVALAPLLEVPECLDDAPRRPETVIVLSGRNVDRARLQSLLC